MPLDTRFDSSNGVLWLIVEGEVDFQEVMRTVDDLYGTDVYDRRIWDVRKTTNYISRGEMEALGAALRRLAENRDIRSALLTTTDLQFGMSRALQPRVDTDTISLGVFKTEEEAVAWVTEAQTDPQNG